MLNFFQYRIDLTKRAEWVRHIASSKVVGGRKKRDKISILYHADSVCACTYPIDKFEIKLSQNRYKNELSLRYLWLKYADKSQQKNDLNSPILRHPHCPFPVNVHALAAYIQGADV